MPNSSTIIIIFSYLAIFALWCDAHSDNSESSYAPRIDESEKSDSDEFSPMGKRSGNLGGNVDSEKLQIGAFTDSKRIISKRRSSKKRNKKTGNRRNKKRPMWKSKPRSGTRNNNRGKTKKGMFSSRREKQRGKEGRTGSFLNKYKNKRRQKQNASSLKLPSEARRKFKEQTDVYFKNKDAINAEVTDKFQQASTLFGEHKALMSTNGIEHNYNEDLAETDTQDESTQQSGDHNDDVDANSDPNNPPLTDHDKLNSKTKKLDEILIDRETEANNVRLPLAVTAPDPYKVDENLEESYGTVVQDVETEGSDKSAAVDQVTSSVVAGPKISSNGEKFLKGAVTSSKVGSVIGDSAAGLRSIGQTLTPVDKEPDKVFSLFIPKPEPSDSVEGKIDACFDEQQRAIVAKTRELQGNMNNGFNTLNSNMLKQFENVFGMIQESFHKLSVQIFHGFDEVNQRTASLVERVDENTIAILDKDYKLEIRKDINKVMTNFKQYARYPTDEGSINNLKDSCKAIEPEGLLESITDYVTVPTLEHLQKMSDGHLSRLLPLLTTVASDAATLNMIIPACLGVRPERKDPCQLRREALVQSMQLLQKINKFINDYDHNPDNSQKLRSKFLAKIKEYSRKNGYVNQKLTDKNLLAHKLLNYFRAEFTDFKFSIFVSYTGVDDFEAYVEQGSNEKMFQYFHNETELQGMAITLYWYRNENQPTGLMWTRCIDEEWNCWLDKKPNCNYVTFTVPMPATFEINADTIDCQNEKICTIHDVGRVPTCAGPKKIPCFEACSSLKINNEAADTQGCYNQKLACFNSNLDCIQFAVTKPYVFFSEGSIKKSVYDYDCINKVPGSNLPANQSQFIGGAQIPVCVTNFKNEAPNYDPIKKHTNLTKAIVEATMYDCSSVFHLPQPLDFIKKFADDNHNQHEHFSKQWSFASAQTLGEQVAAEHEMGEMGYCLLGVYAQYHADRHSNELGVAFASNMNGVSTSIEAGNKEFDKYHATVNRSSNGGIYEVYPVFVYIIHNCADQETEEEIKVILFNYTAECQDKIDQNLKIGENFQKSHEEFMEKVNAKLWKKVLIGVAVTFVGICLIAAIVFVTFRHRKKRIALHKSKGFVESPQTSTEPFVSLGTSIGSTETTPTKKISAKRSTPLVKKKVFNRFKNVVEKQKQTGNKGFPTKLQPNQTTKSSKDNHQRIKQNKASHHRDLKNTNNLISYEVLKNRHDMKTPH